MIKFKPEYLNDTHRRFPRTLAEAFPTAPDWLEDAPESTADRVIAYLAMFVVGFLTALLVFS
jgi:hypothetical protein